ncbi:sugar transferase [Roseicella frigidaeris]|uniref:sugar transferase n=1 Tax=Roseicella frigidaeris TaxID=2230885 RepID=UPI001A9F2C3A|nr:sugar transferase [Roseicella frigidaeris]
MRIYAESSLAAPLFPPTLVEPGRGQRSVTQRQTAHVLGNFAELAFILLAGFGVIEMSGTTTPERIHISLMFTSIVAVSYLARRLLNYTRRSSLVAVYTTPAQVAASLGLGFATVLCVEALHGVTDVRFIAAWALVSIIPIFLMRVIMRDSGWALTPGGIAILCDRGMTGTVSAMLSEDLRPAVVCSLAHDDPTALAKLRLLVDDGVVEAVLLAAVPADQQERILNHVAELPVSIYLPAQASAARAVTSDVVEFLPNMLSGHTGLAKRATDIIGAAFGLVLCAPLILLAVLLIRLESPGPAFFRQRRFGCGGSTITVWKIRSMYADRGDATGQHRTASRDPRVTPIGRILRRLSIDELPQLLNVLRGEMSLVGPRPHAVSMQVEGKHYREAVAGYPIRHRVKPGC